MLFKIKNGISNLKKIAKNRFTFILMSNNFHYELSCAIRHFAILENSKSVR